MKKGRVWRLLRLQKKKEERHLYFSALKTIACESHKRWNWTAIKDQFTNLEDGFTSNLLVCRHELWISDLKTVKPMTASAMVVFELKKCLLWRWSLHIWDRVDKSTMKNHPSSKCLCFQQNRIWVEFRRIIHQNDPRVLICKYSSFYVTYV